MKARLYLGSFLVCTRRCCCSYDFSKLSDRDRDEMLQRERELWSNMYFFKKTILRPKTVN